MYKFNPKTDQQIEEESFKLLADGEYPFKVISIEEAISSKNNPGISIKLLILQENDSRTMKDWLTTSFHYKFKHFFQSLGLHHAYDRGEINLKDCLGMEGTLKIGIQKGKLKEDGSGSWPDKNEVKDYIVGKMPIAMTEAIDKTFNDDIPF